MKRITCKDLEALASMINRITDSPIETYSVVSKGKLKSNIGNYHISYAYGGACLHRIMNEGGGVTCPINSGYTTKRDLYNLMHAFIKGLEVQCK